MLSKKVKLRIVFFSILIIFTILIGFFIARSLEQNIVYFFSPSDVQNKSGISLNEKIRIGGMVKKNSVKKEEKNITFIITDFENEIIVSYQGLVPNLFSEEKGVVAEGKLSDKKYFVASKILAKHDENYMPPEVKKALDKTEN